jgi:hypothetical protein
MLLDKVVEPFAERAAGLSRGFAGGFDCLQAQASEIPRTARFHRAQNHFGGNVDRPVLHPLDRKKRRARLLSSPRLFRFYRK